MLDLRKITLAMSALAISAIVIVEMTAKATVEDYPIPTGQTTMTNSIPIAVATDQTPVPVFGTVATTNPSTGVVDAAAPTSAVLIGAKDSLGFLRAISSDASGQLQVLVMASALPTGAATAANQVSGNASLTSIDSKTPALVSGRVPVDGSGVTQPISAVSLPLPSGAATSAKQPALGIAGTASTDVLTVQGIASMTPLLVNGSGFTQPISGTVAATQSGVWSTGRTWTLGSGTDSVAAVESGTWTVQPGNTPNTAPWLITISQGGNAATVTAGNALKVDGSAVTQPISGTVTANQGGTWTVQQGTPPWSVSQSGSWTTGRTWTLASGSDSIAAVESGNWDIRNITGTVSLPTGASTSANQSTEIASLASIDTKLTSPIAVSQSGTWTTGRTWSLASGSDSVSVVQSTSPWVNNVSQFGGSAVVTGTGNSGSGIPRVTVSNDSSITNISGTVSLPTGASTAANQATIITNLGTIDTDIKGTQPRNITQIGGSAFALGQALAASSLPVVTQSDATPATQNITVQDTASTTTSGANSQNIVTGTPTANSAASFALASWKTAEIEVTGTWTGTIQLEISMNGTNWYSRGVKQSGLGQISSAFTANFQGGMNVSGMKFLRARATAAMTGTATVQVNESVNDTNIVVTNPLMLKDSTTQSITNTIKAASTAAQATDTSIVVGLSPNSALPAGANNIGSITNVTGTVSLPTGAATSAKQDTGNTSLSSIDGKIVDNYGTATAGVRTASQIGNASGAADFNYGTVGAQTVRTASQEGNATGANDYNSGAAGAQTPRVVLATRHEAVATPIAAQLSNGSAAINYNYGTVGAATLRTAAQVGNATGAADFGAGTTTSQTPRVVAASDQIPMISRTDVASAAQTATGNSGTLDTAGFGELNMVLAVTAESGTNETLDIELQASDDASTWSSVQDAVRVTTSNSTQRIQGTRLSGRYYRYVWTIAGTTPSFTFSIVTTLKEFLPLKNLTMFRYGDIDLHTVNATSSAFSVGSCPNVTVVTVRAATPTGAANVDVQGSMDNVNYLDLGSNISTPVSSIATESLTGQAYRFYKLRTNAAASGAGATIDIYWSCNGG